MKTNRLFFLLLFIITACAKNDPRNRYTLLAHHWLETGRSINGDDVDATQLQHIFYSGGFNAEFEYQYVCGLKGDDCLPGQNYSGSWQLLSDSTISTKTNGNSIRLYTITKLTLNELWLKEDKGENIVVSKLSRYR